MLALLLAISFSYLIFTHTYIHIPQLQLLNIVFYNRYCIMILLYHYNSSKLWAFVPCHIFFLYDFAGCINYYYYIWFNWKEYYQCTSKPLCFLLFPILVTMRTVNSRVYGFSLFHISRLSIFSLQHSNHLSLVQGSIFCRSDVTCVANEPNLNPLQILCCYIYRIVCSMIYCYLGSPICM